MSGGKWIYNRLVPDGKLRDAMELYPGKTREEVRALVFENLLKRLIPGMLAAGLFLLLAVFYGKEKQEEPGIVRPLPGYADALEKIQLELGEEVKTFFLTVGAQEYEEAQIEVLHQKAELYLNEVVLGENESLERVTKALVFPDSLPENGAKIYWSTDAPWLITSKGEVLNAQLKAEAVTRITAEIQYGSECRYYHAQVTVYPAEYSGQEAILKQVSDELSLQEEATRTSRRFYLPETVQGYRVTRVTEESYGVSSFFVLLALVVPMLLYSGFYGSLDTKRKQRKELAESGYSEFVTKLSLLLVAGVSVRQAFTRLADEYEKNYGAKHVLSMELKVTRQELDNGCSEVVAYEEFGRRLGVLAFRRMASLLTQNVSKGVQGMRMLLLQEAKEVMAQEKATIRQRGEQAGTKLLLPMMGLLLLVFAILLVPAFQSF